jgi:hypothetical protein
MISTENIWIYLGILIVGFNLGRLFEIMTKERKGVRR